MKAKFLSIFFAGCLCAASPPEPACASTGFHQGTGQGADASLKKPPPAGSAAEAGASACRRAIGKARKANGANPAFYEGLLRFYDSSRGKKAKKGVERSALEALALSDEGKLEILRQAAQEGFIVESRTSALFNLILNQPPETVASVVQANPRRFKVSALNKNPLPLFAAVLIGELQITEAFLDADRRLIHAVNSAGEGLLHYAADAETALFLLKRGADPDLQDRKGFAPLHHARSERTANILLENGASWDLKDRSGKTLVQHHEGMASALASNGAAAGEGFLPEELVREHGKIARLLIRERDRSRNVILAAAKAENDRAKAQAPAHLQAPHPKEEASAAASAAAIEEEAAKNRERQERLQAREERRRARTAETARLTAEREERKAKEQRLKEEEGDILIRFIDHWKSVDTSQYQIMGHFLRQDKKLMIRAAKQLLNRRGGGLSAVAASAAKKRNDDLHAVPKEEIETFANKWKALTSIMQQEGGKVKDLAVRSYPDEWAQTFNAVTKNPDLYLRDLELLRINEAENPVLLIAFFYALSNQIELIENLDGFAGGDAKRFQTAIQSIIETADNYILRELRAGNGAPMLLATYHMTGLKEMKALKSTRRFLRALNL